jgi:hypothetical protein
MVRRYNRGPSPVASRRLHRQCIARKSRHDACVDCEICFFSSPYFPSSIIPSHHSDTPSLQAYDALDSMHWRCSRREATGEGIVESGPWYSHPTEIQLSLHSRMRALSSRCLLRELQRATRSVKLVRPPVRLLSTQTQLDFRRVRIPWPSSLSGDSVNESMVKIVITLPLP